ncbi:MAG: hypothetical protein M1833_003567 [Piccolia ochrophora]|nr:MAG: hypothetical protein M1833_003567 [Piccolia ochrophora]
MSSQAPLLDAVKSRRSYYQLGKKPSISDSKIRGIVEFALLHCPSAFNSQSTRIVILLNRHHEKLWDIVEESLGGVVPADQFDRTKKRIEDFRAAYGTILFFEDIQTTHKLQTTYPSYQDREPTWAAHTAGMHQLIIWTALEAEGLGANLQHYNPLIDGKVRTEWDILPEWNLNSQLVIGNPMGEPKEKSAKPLEERLKVFGANKET